MPEENIVQFPRTSSPPAFSEEERRNQLISLAYDLAEQRIRDGTATSQEVTTILKMGTERARLDLEYIRAKMDLMAAQQEKLRADAATDELYKQAIAAMRRYDGSDIADDESYV